MASHFLGVDVAQADLVAALWQDEQAVLLGRFPNRPAGFAALRRQVELGLKAGDRVHLVVEPTGGYELPLVDFAFDHAWQVSLPNPRQVREWARGMGYRAKTDEQDALLLAHFAARRQPAPQAPLPEAVRELDSLLRRQEDLRQMLRQERNRQHSLRARQRGIARSVPRSLQAVVRALEEALLEIERAIEEHLAAHPELRQELRHLQQVPGIGPKNALAILVLLYRWQALTSGKGSAKGLTAFVGLDPQPYQSGSSVRKRSTLSRRGDATLRWRLFMSALGGLRSKRSDDPLRLFYQRLVSRGKPKKVALVAAARKILIWAWAVFQTGAEFDPQRARAA